MLGCWPSTGGQHVDNPKTITHIGLCAGYGGIEIGLHRVIRNLRTVALCEIEAFACANLVAKMEAGLMDAAPIWTDLKSFPWAEFRDRVDILTGGYPCQPFSAAGKRLGTEDPRHLWPFIADGIRLLRPRLCYFENVEGHISLGLREVIGELGAIGYTAAWGIFSAAEVGAPHQRKRVFILAYDKSQRIQGHWADWLQESRPHAGQGLPLRGGDAGCLANSNDQHGHGEERGGSPEEDRISSEHREEEYSRRELRRADAAPAWPSRPGQPQHGWEPPRVVADAKSQRTGLGQQLCGEECGQGRALPSEPEPTGEVVANPVIVGRRGRCDGDAGGLCGEIQTAGSCGGGRKDVANSIRSRGEEPEHLDANLPTESSGGDSEGLGNAEGSRPQALTSNRIRNAEPDAQSASAYADRRQTEPSLGRDADGPAGGLGYAELQVSCDNRTDELRLLGNGVVPATAERAFRTLWEEFQ